MSDGTERASLAISADAESVLLDDAVPSRPPHAVTDLLSNGVCVRCTSRLFGIYEHTQFCSTLSQQVIRTLLGETMPLDKPSLNCGLNGDVALNNHSTCKEYGVEQELCTICLGIMQFTYHDDEGKLVKHQMPNDLAVLIAEFVKREGHKFESFSLEVSIPPVIVENENLVRLYMERKYGSEAWFKERLSECISVKDAFKFGIAGVLEKLMDIKSASSPCRIRLTYSLSKSSNEHPNSVGRNEACKRRKTGNDSGLDSVDHVLVGATRESVDLSTSNGNAAFKSPFESSECLKFPLEKANKPCHLSFLCYRTPIVLCGRYLKFSRSVSQTRWIIDDERMGEASVEEIIGSNILPICQGDIYKFHAAGREDIDVRMLGSGRPFIVEIQNARQVPHEALVKEMEMKINNSHSKLVGVKNLKVVDSNGWTLMREGEAEKQKQYCALVWISRPLEEEDLQSIGSVVNMQVLQRTPIRVLHRRSPLDREKIIHWMKIEKIAGSSQYFLLHLCTQAGTYIKEFVHGDLGRTLPSIGSILSCRAEILQLDVTDVKMNCFMAE